MLYHILWTYWWIAGICIYHALISVYNRTFHNFTILCSVFVTSVKVHLYLHRLLWRLSGATSWHQLLPCHDLRRQCYIFLGTLFIPIFSPPRIQMFSHLVHHFWFVFLFHDHLKVFLFLFFFIFLLTLFGFDFCNMPNIIRLVSFTLNQ